MKKPRCKRCGGKLQRRGKYKSNPNLTRTWCRKCGDWNYEPSRHPRPARILLLDIETLPGIYAAWSPSQEYLSPEFQIKDWSISCWSAKWLFEPEVIGEVVSPKEAKDRKDGSILKTIWKLVDEAQIVITQNGIRFDMKKLNARWIEHGYKPPSHYKNIDTLQFARYKFGFTYNRLEELGLKFGIGKKTDMRMSDWMACGDGDPEALDKMLSYCKRDVAPLLEDVYLHLLPWMDRHPNMNIYTNTDKEVCANCASELAWNGEYSTPQGLWEGWRCQSCGAIGRGSGKIHKIKGVHLK